MTSLIQRSFTGGELAPSLYARADQVKYSTGLRTCKNFIVQRSGGVANRTGFEFICEVKDSTKKTTMIPFAFNSDQAYVIEVGDQYMRFIRQGVLLSDQSRSAVSISNANPAVVSYADPDFVTPNPHEVYFTGGTGAMMDFLIGRNFKVTNYTPASNTFELAYMDGTPVDSTSWGSYTGGATVHSIYQITTPYLEDEVYDLQFVQSGDIITIVHPNHKPAELARTGHTAWTLTEISFGSSISAPGVGTATPGGAGTTVWRYRVTSVSAFGEESDPNPIFSCTGATPTAAAPNALDWADVTDALQYFVYKEITPGNGFYGFVGVAGASAFNDTGFAADPTISPPIFQDAFNATDEYPSAVTYAQQRLTLGNTIHNPETVYMSRTGNFHNFNTSSPVQEDDSISFTLAGRQVNQVRQMFELNGDLIILTSGGEWQVTGSVSGVITPFDINAKQYGYDGATTLPPVLVGNTALFIQARGTIVKDLRYDYQAGGPTTRDLTVYSSHMFDGFSIVDWSYQKIPHSVVWATRSDGTLLGLTYLREHEIWGWHRHDTRGLFERVTTIPEGNEDTLYSIIQRDINGRSVRYIERKAQSHIYSLAADAFYVDAGLTYDGRNTGSTTITLTHGLSPWTVDDTITVTASADSFASTDVGNEVRVRDSTGDEVSISITTYTSPTVVSGTPSKTVPVSLREVAITNWGKAVDELTNLYHLEGEELAILGDGAVGTPSTVTSGKVTLSRPYEIVHAGLGYTCDIETLDLETLQSETLSDKRKRVNGITILTQFTKGIKAGPDENHLKSYPTQNQLYENLGEFEAEKVEMILNSSWNNNGRVMIRQDDPLPITVLAVVPSGFIGG